MIKIDEYVWGTETIVWGFDPSHKYTFKLLRPHKGRTGCLSLQYHNHKSESWLVTRGVAWCVVIQDWKVTTKVLWPGQVLNLEAGVIHRLMALTEDCEVAEASTLDAHAADKTITKDVIRLHCVHGRECIRPKSEFEQELVDAAVAMTERAIAANEKGEWPQEESYQLLCI